MKREEKFMFCQMLSNVAELFGKTLTPNTLDIYWSLLEKYELNKIKSSLRLHLINPKKGQFMPKPADIILYLEKDNDLKALHAWDKVNAAVRKVGIYNSITFDDPIIHLVITEMQGWIATCESINTNKSSYLGHEFQRRYTAYLIFPPPPVPEHLPGIYECHNRFHGHLQYIPKPVFFGDKEHQLLISHFNYEEEEKDHE